MYYVYLLRCGDGTLYTGITTDAERRLRQHKGELRGGARYTRSHGALRMEAVWECADRSEASRMEARLKKLTREEKEAQIKSCPPRQT